MSKVGACDAKEIATLENVLVVVLVLMLAIAATLHRALGNFSYTQMYAAWMAVPLAVICVSYDTQQFGLLHVLLFQAICILILCVLTNAALPLLLLVPIYAIQLRRKSKKNRDTQESPKTQQQQQQQQQRKDTCPYPRDPRRKAFLWGPSLQAAGIVGLVAGFGVYNLRHAAAFVTEQTRVH